MVACKLNVIYLHAAEREAYNAAEKAERKAQQREKVSLDVCLGHVVPFSIGIAFFLSVCDVKNAVAFSFC